MKIEIAGAQITDAVVDILDDLQNMTDYTKMYLATLDELTRDIILDISGEDENNSRTIDRLRVLQMIRRDLMVLSMPPDADDPKNGKPILSL